MVETYLCDECDTRFGFSTSYDGIEKAPCPNCHTCTLTRITSSSTSGERISAEKTASDLFLRVNRYDGR